MPSIGPYTLLDELGRGGMGVVYRARREDLQREFALKVIAPGADATGEAVVRFRREAQAAARLADHPGIVGVHDIGEHEGRVYFAMDVVDGPSLEALVDEGEMPVDTAVRAVAEAARAVHHAHEHGILHRDLKPGNILLGADGLARVADFGLAKSTATDGKSAKLTKSGAILGTPAYMPPEQADGDRVDRRADVYALGATLFECLADRPPFESDTLYGLLSQIQRDDPPALCTLNPRLPAPLGVIVSKCLEKPPEQRYQTAAALADDLERWLAGEAIAATAPSVAYRTRRWLGRHKALSAGVALGLLGLGAGAAWFLPQLWAEQAARETATRQESQARAAAATAAKDAAESRARQLDALRKSARTALQAVIALRQAGATDRTPPFVTIIEADVAEVTTAVPDAADPHYWLGRVYRAAQRNRDALAAQAAALAADPQHLDARYERTVLLADVFRIALADHERAARRVSALAQIFLTLTPAEKRSPDLDPMQAELGAALATLRSEPALAGTGRGHWANGVALWLAGEHKAATASLAQALEAAPEQPEICEWLALLQRTAADPLGAIATLDAGIQRDRGYLPFWIIRARSHAAAANEARAAGEYLRAIAHHEGAVADYDAIHAAAPAEARWLYERAASKSGHASLESYVQNKPAITRLHAAREDYAAALALMPEPDIDVLLGRAWLFMAWARIIGRHGVDPATTAKLAVADLNRVVQLRPDRSTAHTRLGIVRTLWARWNSRTRGDDPMPQYDQAQRHFDAALANRATSRQALRGRAQLHAVRAGWLHRQGESPETELLAAERDYTASLAIRGRDIEARLARAGLYAVWATMRIERKEDPSTPFEAAEADFTVLLARSPRSYSGWVARGKLHLERGTWLTTRKQDARKVYERAIDYTVRAVRVLGRGHPDAMLQKGIIFMKLGDAVRGAGDDPTEHYGIALADLSRVITLQAGDPSAWRFRGAVYNRLARWRARQGEDPHAQRRLALSDYTEAKRLGYRGLERYMAELERLLAESRAAGTGKK